MVILANDLTSCHQEGMKMHQVLQAARHQSGISQGKLARLLDIDQAHVSRIERGMRSTSFDLLERWLMQCGVRLVAAPLDVAVLEDLHDLDDDRRALVFRLARVLTELPDLLADDLDARVELWEERYLSSNDPTSQETAASSDGDSSLKSS